MFTILHVAILLGIYISAAMLCLITYDSYCKCRTEIRRYRQTRTITEVNITSFIILWVYLILDITFAVVAISLHGVDIT